MLTRDRLGAFIAVLFGTAVVTLSLTLLASASPQRPDRYAAVTVAVRSPGVETPADPFPESRPWSAGEAAALVDRLRAIPGVEAAVSDRRFYAQPVLDGRPVTAVQEGRGWSSSVLAPDPLVAGRAATGTREVVLGRDRGVPVGATVTILTATGPAPWTVTGLIAADRLYLADTTAAELAPGVRLIGLTGRPDPEGVRLAATGATVLHDAGLGDLELRTDARTRWIGMQVLTAMAALSGFACVFVIAATFALTVQQRRREIGLWRAIGATPRQIRRSVTREAAAIGATSGAVGTVLGLLSAPPVGRVLVDAGFEPSSFSVGVHAWPVLAGLAVGPLVSVVGSLAAARRAARVRPLEALRQAEVETKPMSRVRWVVGLLWLGCGAAAGLGTVATDDLSDLGTLVLVSAMAFVVGAAVLAPAAVPLVVRVLLRPVRGPIGTVMRESALTSARRTASTAAPVLLTIAFAVFIAGNVQTSTEAYASRRAGTIPTGTVLVPDGTPGLSDTAAPTAPLATDIYLDGTVEATLGLDAATAGAPATADSVVITESRAARLQVGIGDSIEVTFADGLRTSLRIAHVAADGTIPVQLLLNRAAVRAHDPSALASFAPLPGGSVAGPPLGARVVKVADYAREADAEEDHLVWIFTLLLVGVSVGYGALAVANTLVMATGRRAPDYRLLRLAGATRRQVLLAVGGESALVVAVGALLGGAAAILALWGATAGLRAQTGNAVPLTVPWPIVAIAVATCLVLALAASVLPARAGLNRAEPVRELS